MRTLPLALAALAAACTPSPEQQVEIGQEISQDYVYSVCAISVDDTCVENMRESCGSVFTFQSMDDCVSLYTDLMSMCPDEYYTWLWENEDNVQDCIDSLDGWDCSADDICTEEGGAFDGGACGRLDKAYNDSCF